jgi:hypothetical protein
MKATKGYYCVIQYCPDLGRFEAANVGVLLFCPELPFLQAKMSSSPRRVQRFFGREGHDARVIRAMTRSLQKRLEKELDLIRTLEDLEHFVATRANQLLLTTPRPMKVHDPAGELERLFEDLVGGPSKQLEERSFRRRMMDSFSSPSLKRKVVLDVRLTVPFHHTNLDFEIPLGYQNGRFNLIEFVSFKNRKPKAVFERGSSLAVQGKALYSHNDSDRGPLQLVVVAEFEKNDERARDIAQALFDDNNVELHDSTRVSDLITKIEQTGIEQTGKDQHVTTDS